MLKCPAEILLIIGICTQTWISGYGIQSEVQADELVEDDRLFENEIRPVLVETCFRCHGDQRVSGGLKVNSREALTTGGESGPAIVPGNPQDSLLLRALQRHDDVSAMPPDPEKALRAEQISAFESWIREGARWPAQDPAFRSKAHWAFEPVVRPKVPDVHSDWPQTAIDRFILSRMKSAGHRPTRRADKRTLLRRAAFDLTGLPPSAAETAAFEADTSPDAFDRVIDRLLASPHYGERWARHWLDVVRYADTAGETADYPVPTAWQYRNYVIDAFNSDKPFDQFLREQIAGDILAAEAPPERYAEYVIATGYLAASRRFGFDSENYHHLTIQDTIDTLGQSVMGLSLGCARCHDHKYDPVSMADYYGLYGIFDSSRYAFPGSEQKQKFRVLAPLVAPDQAFLRWRDFERQTSVIIASLEARRQPVPSGILRSLKDLDGDFELQAPAAGGSNGVLVPPWLYEGPIAVTTSAQSPFRNLYSRGRVGASISPGTGPYRITQSIPESRTVSTSGTVYFNLDFRMVSAATGTRIHRIRLGTVSGPDNPLKSGTAALCEILLDGNSIVIRSGENRAKLSDIRVGEWYNVQLAINLSSRMVTGTSQAATAGSPQQTTTLSPQNLQGLFDRVVLESVDTANSSITVTPECGSTTGTTAVSQPSGPGIEFDNLGIQNVPIDAATTISFGELQAQREAELQRELTAFAGLGGHFELQMTGRAPQPPWNPGPGSVVKVAIRAQSPFRNVFPGGSNGLYMPNRGEYDGFGLTLPAVYQLQGQPDSSSPLLNACFDFRCADISAGAEGTWRFYLGHGPGHSAAIELFLNANQFFRRSGDSRDVVCNLNAGTWYQVQLQLDLQQRRYTGMLTSDERWTEFSGEVPAAWDGIVDYSFIDSYGHIGGIRPSIDVDNYDVTPDDHRHSGFASGVSAEADSSLSTLSESEFLNRLTRAKGLQQELRQLQRTAEELDALLKDGPFPMAYGMSEGTPHDVCVQLRGDPAQPGDSVPRGFIRALGGTPLPRETSGSGRRELADWLTSPRHPLTARVFVNRIWQYHFGRGLVTTPNDFGVRGAVPTHPELLDYLASEFVAGHWSIKAMHREILRSAVWQQSSSATAFGEALPAGAPESYAGFLRRRLSAEEIRDTILLVSGELDPSPGQGHPFPSPTQWGFTQHSPFTAVYDHNKRSVYLMTQRLKRHPFLALFDGPDPNASTPDRRGTTVPTQALYFLNDGFVHEKSSVWAMRLSQAESDPARQVTRAWNEAYSRTPQPEELAGALEFLQEYAAELPPAAGDNQRLRALAAFLRTIIGSNEFLHVD